MPRGKKNFTPTQDLILDVLVCRRRLGERFWSFSTEVTKQLMQLEGKGLVFIMNGQVEGSIRAGLTDVGARELIGDATYKSPLERENEELHQERDVLLRLVGKAVGANIDQPGA